MTINVTQLGADLAAKLMAQGTGKFQGMPLTFYHQTANAHTPGQPYSKATFIVTTGINGILAAPGNNEVRATDPATTHARRVLVRRVELPVTIDVGDKWQEPNGDVYEVSALPWADPAEATLWMVGERSAL